MGEAECSACATVWRPVTSPPGPGSQPNASRDARVDALFEQIARAPDDDGSRMVLADLLLERGDPRGEFISLQLAREHGDESERTKGRLRILLGRHARQWLPPGVAPEQVEFRRGFLSCANLVGATDPLHREWLGVEQLHLPARGAVAAPFEVRALLALRDVTLVRRSQLEALVRHRPPALRLLTMLEADEVFGPGYEPVATATLDQLPTVTHFGVHSEAFPYDDVVNPLVEGLLRTLGPRLKLLRVPARDNRVLLLQQALREVAPDLTMQLVLSEEEAGQAWLEFDARRIGLTVRGEPSSAIIDLAKRIMHHAGYGHVEVYAIDRDDSFVVSIDR